jgi:ABC-type glycerol-3-phosphate transport system substrate-binding protein
MRKTEGEVEYYGLASSGPALYEAFFTQGMAPYNETATQINFNNEAGIKTLEYWRSLVVDECMINPVLDPNHGTKIQGQFSQGQVGLLWGTSTVISSIYENVYTNRIAQGKEPLFEMDVLPFPKVTDYYSNQSGGGIVVFNNKSETKTQAAIEFLRWLQAPEQIVYYSTTTGYMPSTEASTQTQAWADYTAITPLKDRVLDMMALQPDEDISVPIGRAKALADEDFGKYAKGIYYDDCTRDISAILTETADRVQYILDTNSW